jgi:hypothetical protein
VMLPVPKDTAADGRSAGERGWQLAHWAVANASALRIERVSYAGREWSRAPPTCGGGRPVRPARRVPGPRRPAAPETCGSSPLSSTGRHPAGSCGDPPFGGVLRFSRRHPPACGIPCGDRGRGFAAISRRT